MQTLVQHPGPRPPGAPFAPAAVTPPASVPLSFLGAAGVGLCALGLAIWFAADNAVAAPTATGVVSAAHVAMLAFLTTAVLGALHQFAPVVCRRPLRSVAAARVTFAGMVATAWILPTGFAHGPEWLVATGGAVGACTVGLAAWNLSGPLATPDNSAIVNGLRLSVTYLVLTVSFGVVYAFDRQAGWFPLLPHRVLAHAHIGLLGWLGLTYVAVAEKLWPMFLLAHRPRARAGAWAVGLLATAVPFLAVGLLFGVPWLAWPAAVAATTGLGAHVVSLATAVKHRRRPLELLHAYLFVSAAFLAAGVTLAAVAAAADVDVLLRGRLVAAEVAALVGWLGLAIVGHAHKIVPFIGYTALRARGIVHAPGGDGRPLLFADLFDARVARATLVTGGSGFALVVSGLVAGNAAVVAAGGGLVAVTGALATTNLSVRPRRVIREARA
jgi:hypothetical protein